MTPYAHSKQMLEADGYLVWRTEVWNQWAHKKLDLYNAFDLVAIRRDQKGVLGVNVCTGDKVSQHITDALKNSSLFVWLEAGNRSEIHGWRKICDRREDGTRMKRKVWDCRKEPVTVQMFAELPTTKEGAQ